MSTTLAFRKDGTFTIVQFTDVHWHNGEPEDRQSQQLMETVLDESNPDLVVLTGDIIAGGGCRDPRASLHQVASIFEGRAMPWAATFGNHDDEGGVSRQELMDVMVSCKMCVAEPGPQDISGVGNYLLRVQNSENQGVAAVLYFIDSGGYASTGIGGYGWIKRDQIAWYIDQSRTLTHEAGEPLPALAFFHIPLPEYDEVWDLHTCYGVKHEAVCCPRINTGLFAAMHEMGDVMGTFVGHDHINDYEGGLHGIRLCYCRGTGYHTYGKEGFRRGARVIQLTEGRHAFESWQHLADGTTITASPEHAPAGRVLTEES